MKRKLLVGLVVPEIFDGKHYFINLLKISLNSKTYLLSICLSLSVNCINLLNNVVIKFKCNKYLPNWHKLSTKLCLNIFTYKNIFIEIFFFIFQLKVYVTLAISKIEILIFLQFYTVCVETHDTCDLKISSSN